MTIKLIGRIMVPVLSVVTMIQMIEAAEQHDVQETQSNSKWTMTLDEGDKPLGINTPFLTLKSENQRQIVQIRFDICPNESSIANLFSDTQHQNYSSMGIMQASMLSLCVKASNDIDLDKAKEIIDSIHTQIQTENVVKKEKIMTECKVGSFRYLMMKHSEFVLPFTFSNQQQPHCFIAFITLHQHKYLGCFIEKFQHVFPELRSQDLDRGYLELSRRITDIL